MDAKPMLGIVCASALLFAGSGTVLAQQHEKPPAGMMGGGGMMSGGGMMGGDMMHMMQGCHRMMSGGAMMPQLPPGNEKLQLQMQAEMMQKMGEILAKHAGQVKDTKPGAR